MPVDTTLPSLFSNLLSCYLLKSVFPSSFQLFLVFLLYFDWTKIAILDAVAADGTALSSAAKRRRKMTTEASAMSESFGKYADYLNQLVNFFFPFHTNYLFD